MTSLAGKCAIITGGASGIGRATAFLFAEHGAKVAIFDRDTEAIQETLSNQKSGAPFLIKNIDLTKADDVSDAIADVVKEFSRLDILINIAGGSGRRWGDGPLDQCSIEGWHKTLDINLHSMFHCSKFVLQVMKLQNSGVIVTISSVLGLVGGDEDFATHAYAASKGAAISLTRSIASYYAPFGIRANVICPGLIATPMSKRAQENNNIRDRLPALQPLKGDFGTPEDIAHAALFLASPEAAFITGSVLTVDGGWTVR